jgi:hypothetical protein
MATLMWEVRAADGRLEDLIAFVDGRADPRALVFSSADPEPRVVVIDPTGRGVPDVPGDLVARPPHAWPFEQVMRVARTGSDNESSPRE